MYVAPVNINYIKTQFPKEAPALAEQFRTELRRTSPESWKKRTDRPAAKSTETGFPSHEGGCIILDVAMVKLKATDVDGNIMSDLVSWSPLCREHPCCWAAA